MELLGSGVVEVGHRDKRELTRVGIRIRDSRRHVVSRMLEALDLKVFRLSRRSFGPVLIGSLKRGGFRYLSAKEVKALKRGVASKSLSGESER